MVQTARTLHQQITLFTLLARQKEEDLCIPISDCTVFYLGSIFSINILSKWLLSASQYLITALQTLPLQGNIFQQNENLQRLCEPNNLIRNYPESSEGSPTKEKPENRLKIRISPVLFLIYAGDLKKNKNTNFPEISRVALKVIAKMATDRSAKARETRK